MTVSVLGRRRELDEISAFLEEARSTGSCLLLSGEPGVGKSVLLAAGAATGSDGGALVLRAVGVEFEASIGFSALNQVVLPISGEIDGLRPAHQEALNVALGFGKGHPPDRLLVSKATLALLRRTARKRPVLVVVDDLQWVDRATAGVLGFVARRVQGTKIGLLAAFRTGDETFFERVGLPEIEVGPLDDDVASQLLSLYFPTLVGRPRYSVLTEARGNPLALLELPPVLGTFQPSLPMGPARRSQGRRLKALFASRLVHLSLSTRELLLLMALDGTGEALTLRSAAAGEPLTTLLEAAERTRLVQSNERNGQVVFRHPLVRTAIVESATSEERRAAHAALANLFAGHRHLRAWHLAAAATAPDENVAAALDEVARDSLLRGDGIGAVEALTRAASLSTDDLSRGRRLTEAAYVGATVNGDLGAARQFLNDARALDPDFNHSLRAAIAASFVMLHGDGDIDTAHRLLVATITHASQVSETNEELLELACHALQLACYIGGTADHFPAFYSAIALRPALGQSFTFNGKGLVDPARLSIEEMHELDNAIIRLNRGLEPKVLERVTGAAIFVGRLGECRDALRRVARDERNGGVVEAALNAQIMLSWDALLSGIWDESQQLADEAVAECERRGLIIAKWSGVYVQAYLAAARGEEETALRCSRAMLQWALPRGCLSIARFAWHIEGLVALTSAEYEEAFRQLTLISAAGELASHVPHALLTLIDVVEAGVRAGHIDAARAHVDAMDAAHLAALTPRLAFQVAACAAISATDDQAVERFSAALSLPSADQWPFDVARVELAFGERLRRRKAAYPARDHLRAARDSFQRLGAEPWRQRASAELRVANVERPDPHIGVASALTVQEHQVAVLAASGMSNKEIAQRMQLSPRTVGVHLYRAFPKLGITSRAALSEALSRVDAAKGP
jgi:DNA-binding CsgD family transcriptional regulator